MSHWIYFILALYSNLIQTISVGYWTSWYGSSSYDTESELATVEGYHISNICAKYGGLVDNIQVDFNNGVSSQAYGGPGGSGPYCWSLATDGGLNPNNACFTSIYAGIGDSMDFLQFTASDGQTTPIFGTLAGPRHTITGNVGECITKLRVRYTVSMRQLQVYFDTDTTPTVAPTPSPTNNPTPSPTVNPTVNPSKNPSLNPTTNPTLRPSKNPTLNPSTNPTLNPTVAPSFNPSTNPTLNPSSSPSFNPSNNPTLHPTLNPNVAPTLNPNIAPTINPTMSPSHAYGDSNEVNEYEETTKLADDEKSNEKEKNDTFSDEYLLNNWYYLTAAVVLFFCCMCLMIGCYVYYYKKKSRGDMNQRKTNGNGTELAMQRVGSMSTTGNGTTDNGMSTLSHSMIQKTPGIMITPMITPMQPVALDNGTGESNTNTPDTPDTPDTPNEENQNDELYNDTPYEEEYGGQTAGNIHVTSTVEQQNGNILSEDDDDEYEYYYDDADEELYGGDLEQGGNTLGGDVEQVQNKQIILTPQ